MRYDETQRISKILKNVEKNIITLQENSLTTENFKKIDNFLSKYDDLNSKIDTILESINHLDIDNLSENLENINDINNEHDNKINIIQTDVSKIRDEIDIMRTNTNNKINYNIEKIAKYDGDIKTLNTEFKKIDIFNTSMIGYILNNIYTNSKIVEININKNIHERLLFIDFMLDFLTTNNTSIVQFKIDLKLNENIVETKIFEVKKINNSVKYSTKIFLNDPIDKIKLYYIDNDNNKDSNFTSTLFEFIKIN